jgi:hypothetical protein
LVPVLVARLAQVALRDAADVRRHGGGEQRDLALLRGTTQDRIHGIGKTHRQHFVGLVQHHGTDAIERQRAAVEVIHDSPGRTDDHMGAALERAELRHIALATIDRQHVEAGDGARIFLECFGHLDRKLARRHQYQRLRRLLLDIDTRQDRQGEGGGLARAGLGLAQDVGAGQQCGDGGGLDRRGGFIAHCRDGLEDGVGEAQFREGDGARRGGSGHGRSWAWARRAGEFRGIAAIGGG